MNVGDIISVSGCITKEKFLAGRPLAEIEKILGFHPGRLSGGIAVVALTELPSLEQFDLAAYSNAAVELFVEQGAKLEYVSLQNLSLETWHFATHHASVGHDRRAFASAFGKRPGQSASNCSNAYGNWQLHHAAAGPRVRRRWRSKAETGCSLAGHLPRSTTRLAGAWPDSIGFGLNTP